MDMSRDEETRRIMKTPWGSWEVLAEGSEYKVKKLIIKPGQMTSYQFHNERQEHWTIVEGRGVGFFDETIAILAQGIQVSVPATHKHRIINGAAYKDLIIIETQIGNCREDDIVRLQDSYNREVKNDE